MTIRDGCLSDSDLTMLMRARAEGREGTLLYALRPFAVPSLYLLIEVDLRHHRGV